MSLLVPPCPGWSLQVVLHCSHSDEACTCGQLVVASRESQYKIFHFHHGGLDKLSEVFQQWKYCTETHLKDQVPERGSWCFILGLVHWRNEALSSCHQARQEAARCWMFRVEVQARLKVSLELVCLHTFLFYLWNMGEDHPEDLGSDFARSDRSALSFRHRRCLEICRDRLDFVSEPFIHLVMCNILFGECFDKASCHILFNLHTNVIRAL